jgi:hypothetical protein
LFEFKTKWEIWQKKSIQILTNNDFSVEETGTLEMICKVTNNLKLNERALVPF